MPRLGTLLRSRLRPAGFSRSRISSRVKYTGPASRSCASSQVSVSSLALDCACSGRRASAPASSPSGERPLAPVRYREIRGTLLRLRRCGVHPRPTSRSRRPLSSSNVAHAMRSASVRAGSRGWRTSHQSLRGGDQALAGSSSDFGQVGVHTLSAASPCSGPSGAPAARRSNSAQRLRALFDAYTVPKDRAGALARTFGPVLLVDDFTDSGWALAVAARLLRQAGGEGVLPLVLTAAG
jgi:hypothetical protein